MLFHTAGSFTQHNYTALYKLQFMLINDLLYRIITMLYYVGHSWRCAAPGSLGHAAARWRSPGPTRHPQLLSRVCSFLWRRGVGVLSAGRRSREVVWVYGKDTWLHSSVLTGYFKTRTRKFINVKWDYSLVLGGLCGGGSGCGHWRGTGLSAQQAEKWK